MTVFSSFFCLDLLVAAGDSFIYVVGCVGASLDNQSIIGRSDIVLLKYDMNGQWLKTVIAGTKGTGTGNGGKLCGACAIFHIDG